VPLPAFYDTKYYSIKAEGEIGLGFDCGAFNPTISLKNSLNQIKSSFIAVENQVLSGAKAAIAELPLYMISRADPSLYNLITNAIAGVQKSIALSTQSCEAMQSQIANGQNPYAHWAAISLGDTWRKEIGTASLSGEGDITQVSEKVGKDAGQSGVPWVSSELSGVFGSAHAGGVNQPPIHIIRDTVVAGFNVIERGSLGEPSDLAQTWKSASEAADWIVRIVGEQTVTTFDAGEKSSTPGVGLYTEIDKEAKKLQIKLQHLVRGEIALNVANLSEISASSISITREMIQNINSQQPVIQSILINKLSQNIAALNVIDKARLAVQLLQTGANIPAIYSNKAAQRTIKSAQQKLESDLSDMMLFLNAKNQLATRLMGTIAQESAKSIYANTSVPFSNHQNEMLQEGALRASQ
jgi:integrating conjugative element protein (TIGR03755 family)